MTMMTPAVAIDQFTIGFVDMSDAGGKLAMAWDKTAAVVPFTIGEVTETRCLEGRPSPRPSPAGRGRPQVPSPPTGGRGRG